MKLLHGFSLQVSKTMSIEGLVMLKCVCVFMVCWDRHCIPVSHAQRSGDRLGIQCNPDQGKKVD